MKFYFERRKVSVVRIEVFVSLVDETRGRVGYRVGAENLVGVVRHGAEVVIGAVFSYHLLLDALQRNGSNPRTVRFI